MTKFSTSILVFLLGTSSLCYGYELKSELPTPPMGCPDILFKTFAAPADPTLSGPLKLAYTYCIYLEGLKEKKKIASGEEKKRIEQDIGLIESLLQPVLVSYSLGDFIFANTNLRDLISQEMQNKRENAIQ